SFVTDGWPSWISPTLAVVPPMSKERMSGRSIVLPRYAAAITPAAGPDPTMNTGRRAAACELKTPPLGCITSSLASAPASESRRSARRRLVEGHEHFAGRPETLDDADGAVARHERFRLLELRVVERGAHLARDLEQVAETVGGDEAAARDLALDDRVRGDRRRVHDEADLRR